MADEVKKTEVKTRTYLNRSPVDQIIYDVNRDLHTLKPGDTWAGPEDFTGLVKLGFFVEVGGGGGGGEKGQSAKV